MKLKPFLFAASLLCIGVASASDLTWAKDYKSALKQAKASKRVVMVDFTATWCVNCHKLDRTTYKDAAVVQLLRSTVPVHVDYDKENAIAKKYKAEALPVIVFMDGNGKEIGRLTGYLAAKDFIAKATPILAKAKKA